MSDRINILQNIVIELNRKPESFSFPMCMAELEQSQKKNKPNTQLKTKLESRRKLYKKFLAVSGIGFAFVFREDFPTINNPNHYQWFHTNAEDYIDYSMKFLGYDCDVIQGGSKEMRERIKESIDRGFPVLAQISNREHWIVICGYNEESNTIISWIPQCLSIYFDKVTFGNVYDEKGLYCHADWEKEILRMVCIAEKSKDILTLSQCVEHWISVMERKSHDGFLFGNEAYEGVIQFLSNEQFFQDIDNDGLIKTYRYLHEQTSLAEARCYTGSALMQNFAKMPDYSPDIKPQLEVIDRLFNDTHRKVWQYWAVIGNNHIPEPDEYAQRIKDASVREAMIKHFSLFKQNDNEVIGILKSIQCKK